MSDILINTINNIDNINCTKTIFNDEIITYYWSNTGVILDILINEKKCAINVNNEVFIYAFDEIDINNLIILCSIA